MKRPPKSGLEYDLIVNGNKVEVKFSLAQKKRDSFMINHVKLDSEFDYLIICCVNPALNENGYDIICKCITKENLDKSIKMPSVYFKRQQGGEKGGNNDWIITGEKLQKFMRSDFCEDLEDCFHYFKDV